MRRRNRVLIAVAAVASVLGLADTALTGGSWGKYESDGRRSGQVLQRLPSRCQSKYVPSGSHLARARLAGRDACSPQLEIRMVLPHQI